MGRILGPLEFLLERPVRIVSDQGSSAIPIDGGGQAVPSEYAGQDGGESVQILCCTKMECQQSAGRIIDSSMQTHPRSPSLEPIVETPVNLDQRALSGFSEPSRAMLARSTTTTGGQSDLRPDLTYRFPANGNLLDLAEFLG
jgi:hypothetical protein